MGPDAGHLYRLSMHSGDALWNVTLRGYDNRTVGSATCVDDIIYITTANSFGPGHLYAMRASDGSVIWALDDIVSTTASVAVSDGCIFISSGSDDVVGRRTYCVDASNGEIVWQKRGIGSAYCSPAVAGGLVIVGNHMTGLLYGEQYFIGTYVLDMNTGDIVWQSSLGGSSPMALDGHIYTIGDGMLAVFGECF